MVSNDQRAYRCRDDNWRALFGKLIRESQ